MATIPSPPLDHAPGLLITRPRGAGETFQRSLGPWRGTVVCAPLMEIVCLTANPLNSLPAVLIFTSKNAVECFDGPRHLPAFCVGAATTAAAAAKGHPAEHLGADAKALVAAVIARPAPGPYLHVRGRHIAYPVAEELVAAGRPCSERIVYDQRSCALTPEAVALLQDVKPVVLPVFSPRSAKLLSNGLRDIAPNAPLFWVAISAAVADQITSAQPEAQVLIASQPDAKAMRAAVHASANHARALEGRSPLP